MRVVHRRVPRLVSDHLQTSQCKNHHSTEMCSGSEAGSYLRLIDSCITQLKAQGPSRTCNESKEEEEDLHTSVRLTDPADSQLKNNYFAEM